MAHHRKRDLASRRRRVEDDGDDEEGLEADLDDDSSEGSILTEDANAQGAKPSRRGKSESTASPVLSKANGVAKSATVVQGSTVANNGTANATKLQNGTKDMEMMLNGLKISGEAGVAEGVQYDDIRDDPELEIRSPTVVRSSAAMDQPMEAPYERRRREHEEYKKKRDADPAFVPNRGAFFMHDHRHAGPAANGFRPFGRGRGRGAPRIGGPFAPHNLMQQQQQHQEPADAPWAHDMHEVISQPVPRNNHYGHGPPNFPQRVPVSSSKTAPPNRSLSGEKHIANVHIRVFLTNMEKPSLYPGVALKQYTRLPDHRPPLRRDKPVRISLPDHPPRYIYPAEDRSFIFIPRAMRPNQQGFGGRTRGRSAFGSVGGYSRQTSVFGGSMYGGGSVYSPSVAQSRRSSLAREVRRDTVISPTGSTMSRSQIPVDPSKPIVKLPPSMSQPVAPSQSGLLNEALGGPPTAEVEGMLHPQTFPPPQKPAYRENRPTAIPMHQPRPQKAVSISDIESPAVASFYAPQQQQQQPFHQQVPIQVQSNGYAEAVMHSRNPSYPSHSAGTPLSQIPERAIHAQPFQPNPYQQSQGYYAQNQSYPVLAPAQGYYYPQMSTMPPSFVPAQQQFQVAPQQDQAAAAQATGQGLVAQEVNGMVYYYDPTQVPTAPSFPQYAQQMPSYPLQHQIGGMMTPSPDGLYYPQANQGVVYYP